MNGGVAPLILNLGTRRRLVFGLTIQSIYSRGKHPDTHCIAGLVGPRVALVVLEKRKDLLILPAGI
jgi:hypothetical protein